MRSVLLKLLDQKGLTLVELLIASLVGALVIMGVYSTFIQQERSYSIQDTVAEMNQNARVGLDIMVREIRMAAYDPLESGNFEFIFAGTNGRDTSSTMIAFTTDNGSGANNGNGAVDNDDREQAGFRVNGTNLQRYSVQSGAVKWPTIAENIESLSFTYFDSSGSAFIPTAADWQNIRVIEVSLTGRTSKADPTFRGDGFRRRTLTTRVKVRNLID